jgi:4,5-dihydroxyphthalate decarboxylase
MKLSLASGNYDRIQPLVDGSVRVEGVELSYQTLFPGDLFRRMIRDGEFDGGELGLTYYLRTLELDPPPFIAIPVFPQRIFRHSSLFVHAESGIESPAQLAGKRIGETFVYGTDAGTWVKGALADDFGVRLHEAAAPVPRLRGSGARLLQAHRDLSDHAHRGLATSSL